MSVNNSLTARSQQRLGLTAYITQEGVKAQINKIVGKNTERFVSSIISAVNANPLLQECTNQSILSGALLGEALNLSPSPVLGNYYLVPYNDKERGKVAQFQLGYKGYVQLAIRSGQYKKLNVLAIKEGELVRFDPLNEEIEVNLIEDEEARENAPTIGYYASFTYTNGFKKAIYWSKKRMESHARKYSKGYAKKTGHTFWEKDFDAMAYKTMLRQLISKWGIMSIDMQRAIESDMAVVNEDLTPTYVDNEPEMIASPAPQEETKEEPKEEPKPAEKPKEKKQVGNVAAALFGKE